MNSTKEVRNEFDRLAIMYASKRDAEFSFIAQKGIITETLRSYSGKLLDFGCGPGCMETVLLDLGFEVFALDLSENMIRIAQERLKSHPAYQRCHYMVGNIDDLSGLEEHFEVVLCMGVFEYIPDIETTCKQIHRVLKPDGHVIISTPNCHSPYHLVGGVARTIRASLDLLLRNRHTRIRRFIRSPRKIDDVFRHYGFSAISSDACNFIFFPVWPLFNNLSQAIDTKLDLISNISIRRILGSQYIGFYKKC